MSTEAETCREYVVPRLCAAGWDTPPHAIVEQHRFTDGRIVVTGGPIRRQPGLRCDYLLRYTRDFPIAVVEAKADYKLPGDGLQQAKNYAEALGLAFAYSTNGQGIVEFSFLTGLERVLAAFPTPDDLWGRVQAMEGLEPAEAERLLTPTYHEPGRPLRYYQEIAVNRVVQAVLQGRRRVLLTMATGTGKTKVAFQICWKLWNARWNRTGDHRRPRILYLADRNLLVDQPKDNEFLPFDAARNKIGEGETSYSREMYFSTYQALAEDERRAGRFRDYAPDYFDLVIVDECHRGSARDTSTWRQILEYFEPAYQLGLTATPLREENRDTYQYFGAPIYTYSLRQGIEDGFLAPYRVHRVITSYDAAGWRPSPEDRDRFGRNIPDEEYQTKDFERVIALLKRTQAIARHLTDFLQGDRFAKTIVFCVDQEHADEMRRQFNNLNADLVQEHADYVCRVTADEGDIGLGHLAHFKDVDRKTPAILTTSQLLTTGVDIPICQNVVLVRVIGSMVEFKQIIGRGTRVREDQGKLYFNILDYTGSATEKFADPEFDGEPAQVTVQQVDDTGQPIGGASTASEPKPHTSAETAEPYDPSAPEQPHRRREKLYFDGGQVDILTHVVSILDDRGKALRVVTLRDYTGEQVRTLYRDAAELRGQWADPDRRTEVEGRLKERGISFDVLAQAAEQPDADPLDLLCHVAFGAPPCTRRERAARLRRDQPGFFDQYGPEARAILSQLLDKYADYGLDQLKLPGALKVPPISDRGNVSEIMALFGGAEPLRDAIIQLQARLYAA
jgi:type I restriction enzyme R subunit